MRPSILSLLISAITSAVLVVTMVTPAHADATATGDSGAEAQSGVVSDLVSEPLAPPTGEIPEGDFSDRDRSLAGASQTGARASAPRHTDPGTGTTFDPETSVLVERDEFWSTYTNENGTNTTVVSAVPQNAEVEGQWVPVETRVESDGDGSYSQDAHPLDPEFAARADEEAALTLSRGGYTISFTLEGAASSPFSRTALPRGQTSSDQIAYHDVFENVDLTYELTHSGVKETLVLDAVPAPGDTTWTWRVDANALDLEIDEEGVINFVNRYGETEFHIPVPVMWDSSGIQGERENAVEPLATRVWEENGSWWLSLTADADWLADPRREYPVMVDPSLWYGPAAYYAYKSDSSWTTPVRTDGIHIGNPRVGGVNSYWRSVVRWDFPQLAGKQLIGAALWVQYLDGATTSQSGAVYNANCFAYNCNGTQLATFTLGSAEIAPVQSTTLSTQMAQTVRDGWTAWHLMFVGSEAGAYSYKEITGDLYLDWKSKPTVAAAVAPLVTSGSYVSTTQYPEFQARANTEVGYAPYYSYRLEVSSSPSGPWTHFQTSGFTDDRHVFDNTALNPTSYYRWSVRVKDSSDGHLGIQNWSAWTIGAVIKPDLPSVAPIKATATPASDSTVTTTTPVLTASVASSTVQYQFRVATGADGSTGLVAVSNWLTRDSSGTISWAPPADTLVDGGGYVWSVAARSGATIYQPEWTKRFRVDLRLGSGGPSPTDTAGPVTVNLANGNLSLSFASPTVATVGGPMGLAFTYNSQSDTAAIQGLRGEYFNALSPGQTSTSTFSFAGKTPVLTRTDPQVSFLWVGTDEKGSPGPSVPLDYFMARWTGYITVPVGGDYSYLGSQFDAKLGVVRDDGALLKLNGSAIVSKWQGYTGTSVDWSANQALVPGTRYPISLEYYEVGGPAKIELWVELPDNGDPDALPQQFLVPADWLSQAP